MTDFGSKIQAGHRVMQDIADRKRDREQRKPLEPLEWLKPNLIHELDIDYDQNKVGEVQLIQCSCKCGFKTEWKSFSEAISDYEDHADNLWECA